MKTPISILNDYIHELDYFEEQLFLMDDGLNTTDILYMYHYFEKVKKELISVNVNDGITYYSESIIFNKSIQRLLKKYKIQKSGRF